MICVLDVTQGPARGRRFWIRTNESVQIGRISTADFSVPTDRHMSRHHLILEGRDGTFRVRDVGSANGTFVNDARVTIIELCNGDRIKAGESIFEVSVLSDEDNPYSEHDITLGSQSSASSVALADSEVQVKQTNSSQQIALDEDSIFDQTESQNEEATDHREIDFDVSEELLEATAWWSEFDFEPSQPDGFFRQPKDSDVQLRSILKRLEPLFAVTAILDSEKFRKFDRRLLSSLEKEQLVTWHSKQICSVQNSCHDDFHNLIESQLGQDALILVASRNAAEPKLLEQFIAQSSVPSAMDVLAQDPKSDFRNVLNQFDFAIYESDESGALTLFRPEARLT